MEAHWNRDYGLVLFSQYDPTARVTTAVRNEALTYYFHSLHYFRHHENDEPFMNLNLYVRKHGAWFRMSCGMETTLQRQTGQHHALLKQFQPLPTRWILTAQKPLADPTEGLPDLGVQVISRHRCQVIKLHRFLMRLSFQAHQNARICL